MSTNFSIILTSVENLSPEKYFDEVSNAIRHKKRWRVAREALLGFFSFAKIRIYKDLCSSEGGGGLIASHPLVKQIIAGREREEKEFHVTGQANDIDIDAYEKEKTSVLLIREADSSQHSAIIDVVHNGKNLCIEGPPGTGKSQTITNIIANALYSKKSVLFVSEKKAALEVVRDRLNHHGLGDFCLELHSQKTQKIRLYQDLGKRLAKGNLDDPSNLDIEIKQFEEEKNELKKYYDILHEKPSAIPDTIYDIFWKTARWKSSLSLEPTHFSIENPLQITTERIVAIFRIVEDFVKLREELPTDIYRLWFGFKPNVLVPGDDEEIRDWIVELIEEFESFDSFYKEFLRKNSFPETTFFASVNRLSKINEKLVSSPPDLPLDVVQKLLDPKSLELICEVSEKIGKYKKFSGKAEQILNVPLPSEENLKDFNSLTKKLIKNDFGQFSTQKLQNVYKSTIQPIFETLDDLDNLIAEIRDFSAIPLKRISDYDTVKKLIEILHSAPADLAIHAYPEHALKLAPKCLERAIAENSRIKNRFHDISTNIKIEKEKNPQELEKIADGLEKGTSWLKRIVSSEYRQAKKKSIVLLQDPHTFKKQKVLSGQIRRLALLRIEEQNFSEEDDARKVLGSLFKGTNTNWERLSELIDWCQRLSTTLFSEGKAKLILLNFSENFEKVQRVSTRMAELFSIFKEGIGEMGIRFNDNTLLARLIEEFKSKRIIIEESGQFFSKQNYATNREFIYLSTGIEAGITAHEICRDVISSEAKYNQILGEFYKGVETELSLLNKAMDWLEIQRKEALLSDAYIEWVLEGSPADKVELIKELALRSAQFHDGIRKFKKSMRQKGTLDFVVWSGQQDGRIEISEIVHMLQNKLDSIKYIMSWSEYNFTKQKFSTQNVDQLVDKIENGVVKLDESTAYTQYIIYQNMAKEIIKQYPDLATFQTISYENMRGRISKTCEAIKKLSEKRICHILAKMPIPHGNGTGLKRDYTDLCLIRNEVSKKRRHVPIRQLIYRSRDALMAMKPCFMMSPLSVAQYLGLGRSFDLVVMDEASQLRLEDAIGAVARGKQLVVVGDPKQLPPSSFFQIENIYSEVEEEDMTAAEDTESILDICQVNFETRRLKWHYRSAHESLIAFSNKVFYDNELIVFPSPYQGESSLGISYHYVDGATYAKGKNRIEAQKVAMAVVDHFKKSPEVSLGVATFNSTQRDLITDELESIQKNASWLETAIKTTEDTEEPFFIKNLETVQGDERSVIMISTTFGPDVNTGIVNQRFGPINRDTGWRRLNVIITRAKQRVELFTSMKGVDIKVHPGSSKGVVALRKYLDFAENGFIADLGTPTGKEPDSDFEIAVMNLLDQYDYKTVPQVGVAGFFVDIGVYNPYRDSEFLCGIECDGATYHSTKSIKDRDILRQKILESKGWDIYRIWSTDWFKNGEREKDKLLNHLEELSEKFRVLRSKQQSKEEMLRKEESEQKQDTSLKRISAFIEAKNPDDELREALLEYRQKRMTEKELNSTGCLLSDTMINLFMATKPVDSEEFLARIPLGVRETFDAGQGKYLPEIFGIIEEFGDL